MGYYIGPGTLALVHDNRVKGSNLGAKTRFGVACGMEGDVVLFKCPYNKMKFRSKSYTIIHLPNYINYYQFLSIPEPISKHSNSHIRPKELKILTDEKLILSQLPSTRAWESDHLRDIKFLDRISYEEEDNVEEEGGVFDGREYVLTGESPNPSDINIATSKGGGGVKERLRENPSYKLKLARGLPQRDYELKGEQYVGRMISKKFNGEDYRGIIVGSDEDKETGDELWVIEYEDGDGEDLTHKELMDVIVPDDDDDYPVAGWVLLL